MNILQFHTERESTVEVAVGTSWWVIARGRLRGLLGRSANKLKMPAPLQDIDIVDDLTGQHVSIRKGTYFTVVSVNGRDYYFKRLTGKFDGTGYQTRC